MRSEKSKKLFVLWWISLTIAGILCAAYYMSYIRIAGSPPTQPLSGFHMVVTAVASLFFYPLLFTIFHYAKKECNRKIKTATAVLLIYMSVWLVMSLITVFQAVITH